ncbi:polyadenylate-binding protein 2-like [Impatiens glandulifera]|uniref:polyadenylate-binding protein 2-like n=1 Tax=Impatiens glandulifera TaxID=253017 RepID=UPI001FB1264F|nr:polyadenylate-binding protein 2-like [Impatiens glandulifera]
MGTAVPPLSGVHQVSGATPPPTPHTATIQTSPGGPFSNASLYVGDLDQTVSDSQLYDLFSHVAPIQSVRVCRDQTRRTSLGYGYVNFNTSQDAAHAKEVLNFTPVNGKPIRIMFSHRDPSMRKSGQANVFIKNLDPSIDNKGLYDTFARFGPVLSCKVAVDSNGQPKGYGFAQFEQEEAAQAAIVQLDGMLMNDKKVYVGLFIRRQDRNGMNRSSKFTNVYVKNFSETTTDDDLMKTFSKYGPITSAIVMRDPNGKSRCFGFINFQSPDDAAAAVEGLNGMNFTDDRVLFAGKAQRKADREAELRARFEQERNSRFEKLQAANLYLKNLDEGINDEKLKEIFSEFGTITSCKVMLDQQGVSKGSGFVAFSTTDEATRAMDEMNGKMIGKKPLYVAVAQRKEERRARLQAQFAQIQSQGNISQLGAGMHGFHHPGGTRVGNSQHQLYFGQGMPAGILPSQAGGGYSFPQHLAPGIRPPPGVPQNFFLPYQLPRHGMPQQPPAQRSPRRSGNNQQQSIHRNSNQGFRYMPIARNGTDHGLMSPMTTQMHFDASVMPATPSDVPLRAPMSMSMLSSSLASATPENQRVMLGEQLYPLVEQLEHENVGKVTGMLLEMDQTEVLHLIEAPDALKKKVGEAMDVLRSATPESEITLDLYP